MQVFVRCPFYKHDDGKRRITCEGIVEESSLVLSFNGTADYRQHLELFCCGRYDYQRCCCGNAKAV